MSNDYDYDEDVWISDEELELWEEDMDYMEAFDDEEFYLEDDDGEELNFNK